jgi:hypothetical protein
MFLSVTTLFATLSSAFRSRSALQLENLALRHRIGEAVGVHRLQ